MESGASVVGMVIRGVRGLVDARAFYGGRISWGLVTREQRAFPQRRKRKKEDNVGMSNAEV